MNKEQKVLLLCSRLQLSEAEKQQVFEAIESGLNLQYLIALAIKHKVLQLVGQHLISLDINGKIDYQYKRLFDFYYLGNKERNKAIFTQFTLIIENFERHNIKAVPLKGAYLAPYVYKDLGLRSLNDLDFLLSVDDLDKASKLIGEMGFIPGNFNRRTDEIKPASRKNVLAHRMLGGNLYQHVKKNDNPFLKCLSIDFSFDVDLKRNFHASRELLAHAVESNIFGNKIFLLKPIDFLIHLCIHLYKESSNIQWVTFQQECNLIKFCDLREFFLNHADTLRPEQIAIRANELAAVKAVYFSFYYLGEIYLDEFSKNVLELLPISDTDFLEEFNSYDMRTTQKWRKTFWERFFSLSNKDEIIDNDKQKEFENRFLGK
ncbi:hypothetical protein D3C81_291240 [compost metagenome]